MRAFATKRIRSWKAFYKFALRLNSPAPFKERGWVFRGQTDDWPLRTSIERKLHDWNIPLAEATSIEYQTVREFRRRLRELQYQRVHDDTLFCLALMQHYGAPTRLLDCTYSPFVAAAFALEKGFACSKPVVWCIWGQWCGEQAKNCSAYDRRLIERRNNDDQRSDATFVPLFQFGLRPKATTSKFVKPENPLHLNDRLTTQQGVFLCPADLSASFEDNLKAMSGFDAETNLVKLTLELNKTNAIEFARNLRNMNVSFASLFSGLEGFARSLGQQITHFHELAKGQAGIGGV